MGMFTGNIWVPEGHAIREATRVRVAVREYDPNLDFGRNEATGQWCIFLRQGTSEFTKENDLPILGFNDIPHPDDAVRRLHQADALRTGNEILDNLERRNRDLEKQREYAVAEGEAAAAEGFEWGFRQMDATPHKKIFMPGDKSE